MAQLKKNPPIIFDYKDVKTLQRYINVYGQIEPISKTGLSEKQQRSLAVAIKRARHLALYHCQQQLGTFNAQYLVAMIYLAAKIFYWKGENMYQPTDLKKGVVCQN